MKNDLLKLITELSLNDTKTLSQKELKLSDEVGDLAKRILAYENADGSRHHVFYKQDILEECADVILVAMSIALSQGYDSDALHSMMEDKAIKWSGLKELDTSNGRYPFEIHLTIDHNGFENIFLEMCTEIGCKPIILDLEGETQVTTASVIYGSPSEAMAEAERIAALFATLFTYEFDVKRIKIETVPWHPMTKVYDPHNYYETHFTFISDENEMERIKDHCKKFDIHMSKNTLKHDVDGMKKFMGTLRNYTSLDGHNYNVELALKYLKINNIKSTKIVTEYAFFDTNKQLDNQWMNIK